MNVQSNDEIDIAECDIKPLYPADTESTLRDGSSACPLPDDHSNHQSPCQDLTGRTGSARLRQMATELRFFPACERQLFMVLEYLSAKLWELQEELERLERQNREAHGEEYKEHQPDTEYGKQKEVLMKELTKLVKTYCPLFPSVLLAGSRQSLFCCRLEIADTYLYSPITVKIFQNANGVLSQPSPEVQYVNGYRKWASCHLSEDPADDHHAADNCRFVGPRPSSIDASFHSFLDFVSALWPFQRRRKRENSSSSRDEEQAYRGGEEKKDTRDGPSVIVVEHSNSLFRGFSHTVMILFAVVFLLLPFTLVSLINMSQLQTVLIIVSFCLAFFLVVIFLFGGLSTEHKFLLFFAYAGAMVTMLASINKDFSLVSIPGLNIPGVTDT
ncbi:hypothetical protein V8F06_010153 [Rhypophila decipiens]